ncbi:MAG: glutamate racemase [Clostridia bacterium]|nr:glutamate racemase [Clostridia bacterium]
MSDCSSPIAVVDSGVGGISVLKELLKVMPYENFLYYGDNKNAPYGTKTAEQVRRLMFSNAEYLIKRDAKAIVIACNTATGAAAKALREAYKNIPIIGIEPAIKQSAKYKEHSNVLVMATPLTLHQEKFYNLMDRFSDEVNIITLPCPGLMELVEEGKTEGEELDGFLKKLFEPYAHIKIDSVVLGCTHYPHVKNAVKKALGGNVMIFDGGEGTARETKRRLAELGLLNPSDNKGIVKIECSAKDRDITQLALKLLKN